jgi:hypothetical protein
MTDRIQWSVIITALLAQEIAGLVTQSLRGGWAFVRRNVRRAAGRG